MVQTPDAHGVALVDLGFAAFGVDGGTGGFEFGVESPIEFGPGGIAVEVDGDIPGGELALGECFAHQFAIDVVGDVAPAAFVAEGMDERGFGEGVPDFGGKVRVSGVDGSGVAGDLKKDVAFVGLGVRRAVRGAGHTG